jgi:hypothetical protein
MEHMFSRMSMNNKLCLVPFTPYCTIYHFHIHMGWSLLAYDCQYNEIASDSINALEKLAVVLGTGVSSAWRRDVTTIQ